jgi:hypothetical protein
MKAVSITPFYVPINRKPKISNAGSIRKHGAQVNGRVLNRLGPLEGYRIHISADSQIQIIAFSRLSKRIRETGSVDEAIFPGNGVRKGAGLQESA